jgi:hypothetical protein
MAHLTAADVKERIRLNLLDRAGADLSRCRSTNRINHEGHGGWREGGGTHFRRESGFAPPSPARAASLCIAWSTRRWRPNSPAAFTRLAIEASAP